MARCILIFVLTCLLAGVVSAQVPEGLWVPRASEVYNLEPGESMQIRINHDDLPVRSWILSIEGGLLLCDVNILRLTNESLFYQQHDESLHRVRIPWGRDEALVITLTADTRTGGSYTVKFLAPPVDQAERSYGYTLNRALEGLIAGDTARASSMLHDVIAAGGEDAGVGCLLLASVMKNQGEVGKAAGLLDMALARGLPSDLEHVEQVLMEQLSVVRNRLSPDLIKVDRLLAEGNGREAVYRTDVWLEAAEDRACSRWELCEGYRRLGHGWQLQGDLVRAQDSFDQALRVAVDQGQKALVYYRLGLLQYERGNPDQARRALQAAQDMGLPPDLMKSTQEILNQSDILNQSQED